MKDNRLPVSYVTTPTKMAAQLSALTQRPVIAKQRPTLTLVWVEAK